MFSRVVLVRVSGVSMQCIEALDAFVPMAHYLLGGQGMNALVTAW